MFQETAKPGKQPYVVVAGMWEDHVERFKIIPKGKKYPGLGILSLVRSFDT